MYAKCHTKMIFKRPLSLVGHLYFFVLFYQKKSVRLTNMTFQQSFDCLKNHERHSEMRNIENVNI